MVNVWIALAQNLVICVCQLVNNALILIDSYTKGLEGLVLILVFSWDYVFNYIALHSIIKYYSCVYNYKPKQVLDESLCLKSC